MPLLNYRSVIYDDFSGASAPPETPTALEKPYKHVFWEGKIQFKKRKAPVNQLPSMISSKQYRSLVLNKTKNVKRRKTASDDLICAYCQRLWSEDNSSHVRSVWVKRDKCPLTMHFRCIPHSHTEKFHINVANVEEEEFCCESCIDN